MLSPKRLNNTVITGPMLASLAEAYVEAINTGAVPTIATAWQVAATHHCLQTALTGCAAPVMPKF